MLSAIMGVKRVHFMDNVRSHKIVMMIPTDGTIAERP